MADQTWSKDIDDRHYDLELKDGYATVSSVAPPEYRTMQSARCTLAEFAAGKISSDVREIFGDGVLAEALTVAKG